jgi:hypothetical protein
MKKTRILKMFGLFVIGLVLTTIIANIISEGFYQWDVAGELYREEKKLYEDCGTHTFKTKYPKLCEKHKSHRLFFSHLRGLVYDNVSWCGIDSCGNIFSSKTAFFSFIVVLILKYCGSLIQSTIVSLF